MSTGVLMRGVLSRSLLRLAIFPLLLPLAGCSNPQSDPVADILRSFAGSWKVVSLERGGKRSDAAALQDMDITVDGDKLKITEVAGPGRGKGEVKVRLVHTEDYIIQVNPAKTGEIDLVHLTGTHQGKSRLGRCVFEGERLKLCLAAVGDPRPEQLLPDSKNTVFVLERQAAGPQPTDLR